MSIAEQVEKIMENTVKNNIIDFNDKISKEVLDKNIFKRFLDKDRIYKSNIIEDIDLY